MVSVDSVVAEVGNVMSDIFLPPGHKKTVRVTFTDHDDVEITGGGFHGLRGYVQHVRYSKKSGSMIEVMVTFPPHWVQKL